MPTRRQAKALATAKEEKDTKLEPSTGADNGSEKTGTGGTTDVVKDEGRAVDANNASKAKERAQGTAGGAVGSKGGSEPALEDTNTTLEKTDGDTMVIDGASRGSSGSTPKTTVEESVALAAMQEAATIVMEAENQKKRKAAAAAVAEDQGPASKRAAPTRTSWEDRLLQLQTYAAEHGNLLIPIRYKLNPSLGKFVHNMREQYKLYHKKTPPGYKKKCSLTAKRIAQLDALDFAWTTERTKRQNEDWTNRFGQLKAFKEKNGHCMVPHGYPEDPSFAEWIHRQRTTYASMLKDDKPNEAVQGRMELLRALGFNFTVHSDKWMYHWEQLKAYKAQNGDCQVPTHYSENPKLGRWVHTQRHQRRLLNKDQKSCMTKERIDMLDQLGFSWEVRPSLEHPRASWQQRLEELTEYKYGHDDFKVDPAELPQLHAWCIEQRVRLRAVEKNDKKDYRKMTKERIEALHAIGFNKDVELLDPLPPKPDEKTKAATVKGEKDAITSSKKGSKKKNVAEASNDDKKKSKEDVADSTKKNKPKTEEKKAKQEASEGDAVVEV